jgi:hypothetical protein
MRASNRISISLSPDDSRLGIFDIFIVDVSTRSLHALGNRDDAIVVPPCVIVREKACVHHYWHMHRGLTGNESRPSGARGHPSSNGMLFEMLRVWVHLV